MFDPNMSNRALFGIVHRMHARIDARVILHPLQLLRCAPNFERRHGTMVAVECGHEGRIGQRVDEPRHPAGKALNLRERVVAEDFAVGAAGNSEAMLYISPRFGVGQGR